MSIADDRLEIWMGRFLDGEISPAEQRLLENELDRNREARELLEQLRTLHECGREVVAGEVLRQGADPQVVFDRAWQQHKRHFSHRFASVDGHLRWGPQTLWATLGGPRFAVGLAAGLILGLVLHFVLIWGVRPAAETTMRPIAQNMGGGMNGWSPAPSATRLGEAGQITRNVDWYGFTDQAGNRWLVQGVREGTVKPAVYRRDF